MAEEFSVALRNIARGDLTYRHLRHRIFVAAANSRISRKVELGSFLSARLLTIRSKDWFALAFDDKDWRALSALQNDRQGHWAQIYAPLALDYVLTNAARVKALYERDLAIGELLFTADGEAMSKLMASFDAVDEQSLFAFRVQAAQYSLDADNLVVLLNKKLKTDWLRRRYLYPLVYQATSSPSEAGLDDFLSFVVTGEECEAERATLRFLLRDDLIGAETLAFKCYVALLCHPFDACEILLNHIEAQYCREGKLDDELVSILKRLHAEVPSPRSGHLVKLCIENEIRFHDRADANHLETEYGFDGRTAKLLAGVASLDAAPVEDTSMSRQLAAICRMRLRKYPMVEDFDLLVHSGRGWWFCEGGRLLNALMTSLYMVPRRDADYEVRDLLRLVGFFGGVSAYLAASPSWGQLGRPEFAALWGAGGFAHAEAETDIALLPASDYDDRLWIKAVQWSLRSAERRMQVNRWLAIVQNDIRVAPAYLTGIDWSWLEAVIRASRLRPFMGDPAGLYALLLLKVEDRDRHSGALRTAIEPIVEGKTLDEVVDWLIGQYGVEAVAFVRFLLEVDDILWLGLAPNRTAALAGRIHALQRCIMEFGYTDILPETLFRQEWDTLNSALLLSSMNAGQFEIPWTAFIRDAAAKHHDLYTTAHSLEPAEDGPTILATSRTTFPYRYRNGKIVTYIYPHRLTPVVALIVATVEDFLAHPAFGLEMILSTRFRHDTLRRELSAALEAVSEMYIAGVFADERRDIIGAIEAPVLTAADEWLDRRMHTIRPDKPDALFDVIPAPEEMTALAEALPVSEGADRVITEIVGWIRARLDAQLPRAKAVFLAEVPSALEEHLAREKALLLDLKGQRAASVEKVMAAAHSALDGKAHELVEWFKDAPENARPPLTFGELRVAADALFEAYKERRGYKSILHDEAIQDREIASDKARLFFDLLREIFAAALDHTAPHAARVRVLPQKRGDLSGLSFSNLVEGGKEEQIAVAGDPYESLDEVIFREGNSGIPKIAAIAATIAERSVTVEATSRPKGFHLFVPLWCDGGVL